MRESIININNVNIRYLEAGTGSPLLMLHSWPYCADIFFHNINELAGHYRVIAPDFPGFGLSRPFNESYSLGALADFVIEFAEKLALGRINIVGVSMGGTIALLVASKYPSKVKRVVVHSPIYNPDWFWKNPKLASVRFVGRLVRFPLGKLALSWYMRSRFHYWMRITKLNDNLVREDIANIRKIYGGVRNASSQAIVEIFRQLISYDFEAELRNVVCPVMVIQGGDDLLPRESMEYLCNQVLKHAELMLINHGTHDLVVERHVAFNKLVRGFI